MDFRFLPSQTLERPIDVTEDAAPFRSWDLQQPHSASSVTILFPWVVPLCLPTSHVCLTSAVAEMSATLLGRAQLLADSKEAARYEAKDGLGFALPLVACRHSY